LNSFLAKTAAQFCKKTREGKKQIKRFGGDTRNMGKMAYSLATPWLPRVSPPEQMAETNIYFSCRLFPLLTIFYGLPSPPTSSFSKKTIESNGKVSSCIQTTGETGRWGRHNFVEPFL
jgi:hypothetical protein